MVLVVGALCVLRAAAAQELCLDGQWKFRREGAGEYAAVDVPHDWAIAGPFVAEAFPNTGKLPWKGKGEYRRTFVLGDGAVRELAQGGSAYLEFDGVLSRPRVFVNGRDVGGWDYGYMSFRLDVSRAVRAGENEVRVTCDTTSHGSRWYPGGGLFRSVRLLVLPRDHVVPDSVFITTPAVSDERAVVEVAFKRSVSGPTNYAFVVERPRLWDVEDPQLYALELDGRTYRYGIRDFRFTGDNGFVLNGRRVQLKGVNLHSDFGPLGVAFNRDAMKRQLLLMKDMGVNALRTAHNAPAPQVLDLCDELGIVVWNECFDKWDHTAGIRKGDDLEEYVARNLRTWVRRDRNHPSVFVWSVGNEIPAATADYPQGVKRSRCAFFRSVVRELDRTRPVGIGCCHPDTAESGALDDFDITGWNYARRYAAMKRRWPDKPILYTESASALSGYGEYTLPTTPYRMCYDTDRLEVDSYDRCSAPWSDIPDVEFNRMEQDRFVGGEFVWTGIDYLGEPTPYAPIFKNFRGWFKGIDIPTNRLARSSYFGAADLCGIPKDRWYLYRSYWNEAEETVRIVPGGWNFEGMETVPVYVYTSGDEAELFLNGLSLGRRRKQPVRGYGTAFAGERPPETVEGRESAYYDICDRYRLRWQDVRYEPGRLEVVAYRKGERIGSTVVRTAGRPTAVRLTRDPYEPDGSDLAFVQVDVVDAAGVRDPQAGTEISFSVEGPGKLVAVGNGNARGLDSFAGAKHPLYKGKALAVVKLDRKARGRVVLRAEAAGLAPAAMSVSENLTTGEAVSRRCAWFDDTTLGMFIHWGLYSIPARGEWVMYREKIPAEKYNRLADEFRQDAAFSPEEWVRLAVRMGAKYAVLTTRHHDGFCLWDTKTTDFNSVKTAAGRDYVREFAEACRRHGLKVGFYLSTKNWQFPMNDRGVFDADVWERMVEDTHAALTELMTNYGKVDVLWHDGCQIPGETDVAKTVRMWRADELNALARRLQPGILINDRAHCDFDFVTPEQTLAGPPRGIRWESCMTVNGSWGYTAGDEKWKTGEELVRALLQCQRFGGRMLINIGPRADGSVPEACRRSLEQLGDYIARCPDSFRRPRRDAYTEATHEAGPVVRSGNAYYLHTFGKDPRIDGVRRIERAGEGVYRVWRDDTDCPAEWLGGRHDLEVRAGDAPVLGDVTSRFAPPTGALVLTNAPKAMLPTAGDWKVEVGHVNGAGFKDAETVRAFVAGPSEVNFPIGGATGYYAVRATPDWRVIDPRRWSVAGVFPGKFMVTHDVEDAYSVLDRDMTALARTVSFVPVVAANAENERGHERVYAFPSAAERNFGFMLARTVVSATDARTISAAFASDYWGDVYVNGRRIVLDSSKPSRIPQFNGVKPVRFDLELQAGDNEILVMNHGGTGPQWFVFYVNDSLCGPTKTYEPESWNLRARESFAKHRFGIFLHWGIYANYGQGEWFLEDGKVDEDAYSRMMHGFCPSRFNADEWARTFRSAGAKYVTITARHHDGFSMWPTRMDDGYHIGLTPFRRDIIGELATACRREGLDFNLYYSLVDWHRKDYPAGRRRNARMTVKGARADYPAYRTFMMNQIAELLDSYRPSVLWFDGEWDHESVGPFPVKRLDWGMEGIYDLIHSHQTLVANNHHKTVRTKEDIQIFERDLPGESTAGYELSKKIDRNRPLEQCDVIQQNVWGYKVAEKRFRTAEDVIALIVRAAAKGSNLLLNIGPEGSGALPASAVEVLSDVGRWFGRNGESVYGTHAAPFPTGKDVVATAKGNFIYLHFINPAVNRFAFRASGEVSSVTCLDGGEAEMVKDFSGGVVVSVCRDVGYVADLVVKIGTKSHVVSASH